MDIKKCDFVRVIANKRRNGKHVGKTGKVVSVIEGKLVRVDDIESDNGTVISAVFDIDEVELADTMKIEFDL